MPNTAKLFALAVAACAMVVVTAVAQPGQSVNGQGETHRAQRAAEAARQMAVPPAGPMSPTDRIRLHEDTITLPFVIDEPGSYVLTSNLTGVAGEHGIIIAASEVTIDLNGFTLRGVEGSGNGITTESGSSPTVVAILNGYVTGWGEFGVLLGRGDRSSIDRVTASRNGSGFFLGRHSSVTDSAALKNAGTGISTGEGTAVENCNASENGGTGIFVRSHGLVKDCVARLNEVNGIIAFRGTLIEGSNATGNGRAGFSVTTEVTIRDSRAYSNQAWGIEAAWGCTVTSSEASSNALDGIKSGHNTIVQDCTFNRNGRAGASLGDGSSIRRCTLAGNTASNGVVGALVLGANGEVEGNIIARGFGTSEGESALLVELGPRCTFRGNSLADGDANVRGAVATNNILKQGATMIGGGPGVAPIVDNVADAGPLDNIRLPN